MFDDVFILGSRRDYFTQKPSTFGGKRCGGLEDGGVLRRFGGGRDEEDGREHAGGGGVVCVV